MLNETILKNNYRVLQSSWKKNELKADSEIFKDRLILGSFNVWIVITFVLFWPK